MRLAQAEGGNAAVLQRGDTQAGGLLVILAQHGAIADIFERGHDFDGRPTWRKNSSKPLQNNEEMADYLARRHASDPDLWVVELDIADSERFAAEMIAMG